MRIVIPLVFLIGCSRDAVPLKGPCGSEERAAIFARYNAALLAACAPEKPLGECEAYPALKKRYEQEREEWNLCSRK